MLLTESVKQLHKAIGNINIGVLYITIYMHIGDGSKKFILMLAAVLREVKEIPY